MPAPEGLQVGRIGERALDLHEHVARPGLGARQLLDAEIAGSVEHRRPQGVKAPLSASPCRYSSTPSSKRSSARCVTGGRTRLGSSAIAAANALGVADREPAIV